MRRTVLAILITTLVFSFGVVDAAKPFSDSYNWIKEQWQNKAPFRKNSYEHIPSPVNDNGQKFTPIYDALGIASNVLICNKRNVYYKRDAYAAVHQGVMLEKTNKFVKAGCIRFGKYCWKYPSNFVLSRDIGFNLAGPYKAFPIQANGKIYNGSLRPVSDLVVYDRNRVVVGIVHSQLLKYTKCLRDDRYIPQLGFLAKLKNRYRNWKII